MNKELVEAAVAKVPSLRFRWRGDILELYPNADDPTVQALFGEEELRYEIENSSFTMKPALWRAVEKRPAKPNQG